MDLRLKEESLPGGFCTRNLYYHSVSWLAKDKFGAARLLREVADAWVSQRFSHCGQKFSKEEPALTQAEINSIPGAASSMSSLDAMSFNVLERVGNKMEIKKDEHVFWASQGGQISEEYEKLRKEHLELIGVECPNVGGSAGSGGKGAEASESGGQQDEDSKFETAESADKLKEQFGLAHRVSSEVQGVEILITNQGAIWLLSQNDDKVVPRHSQLGGFGTGQYVPRAHQDNGVEFNLTADSAIVQLDMSTFRTDGSGVSTMSLYKMLMLAEKEKNMTNLAVSWLSVSRKTDATIEAGMDGFEIVVKTPTKFCRVEDPRANQQVTCKNLFGQYMAQVTGSSAMGKCFRFRFERVGGSFKVQRPYVISVAAISLKKGQPLKVSE